jgi:aspartyl-tRNA(Asn)/glutamyl-tRNA(Gln) amidotransferase subunit A
MSPIAESVAAIVAQSLSAEALLEQARERAGRAEELNAIAHVDWESAFVQARGRDEQARAGGRLGPLHGVPVSIKDLFNVRDMPTLAGTRASLDRLLPHEATLVTRLRDAGAVVFAKTNMHEIALGATGENHWTGDVKNPFDPLRQAGGSSSGAGVAVATGIGMAGIGSDTGGSVRIPAAFCGVTGFKPSFGAIPLDGALYLSWTCDHAGPLARSVNDCALLFEVMAQRRVSHGAVARQPKLLVPTEWLRGRLQPAVREHFERVVQALREAGADIDEVATPLLAQASQCYTSIVRAEAAWVHQQALAQGAQGFSELVMPALQGGRELSAVDYIDALQQRQAIMTELAAVLAGCDALLLPTSAALPPLRGQAAVSVEGGTLSVREAVLGQTLAFSMCGLPALSIPAGLVANGYGAGTPALPAGLQLVGRRDGDAGLLALGRWVEARVGDAPAPPGY